MTPTEQGLLYLLAANDGRVLIRNEIMDHVWGMNFVAECNVFDRHMRNLLTTLQDSWTKPRYIVTVPGRGYRFGPEPNDTGSTPI